MTNYLLERALKEARELKQKKLDADPERQAKKKEALESMNTIKTFQDNAKDMKEKIIPTQD